MVQTPKREKWVMRKWVSKTSRKDHTKTNVTRQLSQCNLHYLYKLMYYPHMDVSSFYNTYF